MTVGQLRGAVCAFFLLGIAIATNALFLQNDAAAIASAKARAERASAKAELLRAQRLSLGGVDRKSARRRAERRGISQSKNFKAQRQASNGSKKRGRVVLQTARLGKTNARYGAGTTGAKNVPTTKRELVRAVQRELAQRGYEPGLADGLPGLITQAAILAYQHDQEIELTGEPSESLLRGIVLGERFKGSSTAAPMSQGARPQVQRVIRTVQQSLSTMGYNPGTVDGMVGEATVRAIREFEMDHNLVVTGRVSGHLVAQLARIAGGRRVASKRK